MKERVEQESVWRMAGKSSAIRAKTPRSYRTNWSEVVLENLLDLHLHGPAGHAVGLQGDKAVAIFVEGRPERGAVGLGNGQGVDRRPRKEPEAALHDVGRQRGQGALAAEKEHQPVRLVFVGLLRDDGEQVKLAGVDPLAGL